MKTIDTRGHLCPTPLIMTKRAITGATSEESFEILSDNDTARCNLLNYLQELGIEAISSVDGDHFNIKFNIGQGQIASTVATIEIRPEPICPIPTTNGYAIVLKSQTMGLGDDSLGAILMRACINSLGELDTLPSVVVMYNAGVMLAQKGSDTAESLMALAERGVEIIVCGTCVDFYNIKGQLAVGTISNMYKINTVLSQATKVVYP